MKMPSFHSDRKIKKGVLFPHQNLFVSMELKLLKFNLIWYILYSTGVAGRDKEKYTFSSLHIGSDVINSICSCETIWGECHEKIPNTGSVNHAVPDGGTNRRGSGEGVQHEPPNVPLPRQSL